MHNTRVSLRLTVRRNNAICNTRFLRPQRVVTSRNPVDDKRKATCLYGKLTNVSTKRTEISKKHERFRTFHTTWVLVMLYIRFRHSLLGKTKIASILEIALLSIAQTVHVVMLRFTDSCARRRQRAFRNERVS